jgi:AP-4 complex subunit sigma-1
MAYLEFIHNLVETMDKYFENVCELDIMYNI